MGALRHVGSSPSGMDDAGALHDLAGLRLRDAGPQGAEHDAPDGGAAAETGLHEHVDDLG